MPARCLRAIIVTSDAFRTGYGWLAWLRAVVEERSYGRWLLAGLWLWHVGGRTGDGFRWLMAVVEERSYGRWLLAGLWLWHAEGRTEVVRAMAVGWVMAVAEVRSNRG